MKFLIIFLAFLLYSKSNKIKNDNNIDYNDSINRILAGNSPTRYPTQIPTLSPTLFPTTDPLTTPQFNKTYLSLSNTMKPKYSTDEKLMCGVIEYNNKTYLVDLNDKDRIINFNKSFVFVNESDIYPSYCYNYKRFSYLDFIFNYNQETVYFIFKNQNQYDLRRNNVEIYHIYHKIISQKYENEDSSFVKF
jgi:hypothetical protein